MRMYNKGKLVVDLSREFIRQRRGQATMTQAAIGAVEERDPFRREVKGGTLREKMLANLADDNVLSQKGLIEMFDSTIGASTVLLPFGGRTQRSETQVSVQKLPTDGYTDTASIMAFGYNPSWRRGVPTTVRPMPSWTLRPKSWRRVPATIRCAIPIRSISSA